MCLNIDLTLCHDFPRKKNNNNNNKTNSDVLSLIFSCLFFILNSDSTLLTLGMKQSLYDDLCKSSNVDCNFTFNSESFTCAHIASPFSYFFLQSTPNAKMRIRFSPLFILHPFTIYTNKIYVKVDTMQHLFQ
jgi:hypothetical protein